MNLQDLKVLILDEDMASLEHSRAALASYIPEANIFEASSAVETMRILEYQTFVTSQKPVNA